MDKNKLEVGQSTPLYWDLTDDQRMNYQALHVLYLITENMVQFPNFLEGKLRYVQDAVDFLDEKNLIVPVEEFDEKKVLGFTVGKTEVKYIYQASEKAVALVKNYRKQFREFIRLYDVYAHVDPETGEFAMSKYKKISLGKKGKKAWKKYIAQERWVDYRVPVAIYKGMDPREFIFFSFMEERRYTPTAEDTEHQWAEDIFAGKIWEEMGQVLESSPQWEEQGDEDNPAKEIMETIILEGASVYKSQLKKLRKYIKEQENVINADSDVSQEFVGEASSDDEEDYFEDPIYYHGMYHYTPLTDPLFWVTAAIIL